MSLNKQPQKFGHVLLDTSFISKSYHYYDTIFFDKMFNLLKKDNYYPVINDLIKFEYLRNSKTNEQARIKLNYLKNISDISLPITKEIYNIGLEISNIYTNKNINPKQISPIDCFNSAFIKNYSDLVLLTLDTDDYPMCIHDRIKVEAIDTDKEILVLSFYNINELKFKSCKEDFLKT